MKSDFLEAINEALTIELGDYQPVELEHFSRYTEGKTYVGEIYHNSNNLIFSNKQDYEYCRYYNKKGTILEMSLPTYSFDLFILSFRGCQVLKDAINYKSSLNL